MSSLKLQWIDNAAIDKQRYDDCIDKCEWGKVYALSWYLDLLTNNKWELLVGGDYEVVMPVPFRKKFGIKYTYRPNFCQQLGIFSESLITLNCQIQFINELTRVYKHINYPLNHSNLNEEFPPFRNTSFIKRTNLILNLNSDYESIYENYSGNLKKNLRKAKNAGLQIKQDIKTSEVISVYKSAWQTLHPIPDDDYNRFSNVVDHARKIGISQNFGIFFNKKILASCVVFKYKNRIYYPFSGITKEGRNYSAIAFLIDGIISIHCNSNIYLDFEGSDIQNVKYFYQKFSPDEEHYFLINKIVPFWESFSFLDIFLKNVLHFSNK